LGEKLPNQADYVLAPEDVLDINVWKNDALTRTVFIRPDGKISLPLIGDVQAAGLTPDQLKDIIKELLKEYKEFPEVSVVVRDIGSFAVYITGQVVRPGKLQLRSETTLVQALTQAGGFTPFAEPNKILVLRREGDYETRMKVRYDDIVSGRRLSENIVLKRGDTIIVP
jgi:polysaccharide export outer membrane protein